MFEPSEAVQFACHLSREIPKRKANAYHVARLADELMRLSRRHNRIQCKLCNGDYNDKNLDEFDPAEKLEDKITQLCKPYGITPIFSGDPRGCTVKLKVKSGTTNDWAHEGICVPQ